MIKREIKLDEETNRILDSLATEHDGDISLVVSELLHTHALSESDLDAIEEAHAQELKRQKERSERQFQEGKVVPWTELKRQCGL